MFDKAVEVMKRAMRLSPYYPIWYLSNLGEALTMAGYLKEAISVNHKLVERGQKEKNQNYEIAGHAWLAIGYSMLGRDAEARSHVAEVLKVYPDWSLEFEREVYSYKNSADLERHLDALRKLGIPEKSPQQRSD
jgi:adenylate cyclase